MKTELPIYIRIAEAMEALAIVMDPSEGEALSNPTHMLTFMRNATERAEVAFLLLSIDELTQAS